MRRRNILSMKRFRSAWLAWNPETTYQDAVGGITDSPLVVFLDLGGSDAPSPDPNIGIAAAQNAAISKEALEFNKQMYEESKPRQAASDALATKVVEDQLAISKQNQEQAASQWERFKTIFAPVEDQVAKDAMTYDSQEELDRAAGDAATGLQSQFDNANAQRARAQAAMGVNPNSGRAQVADSEAALGLAGAKAGAATTARVTARDKGIALRAGAANFGRNMPNTAATAYSTAVGSGNSAVANQNAGAATANAAASTMNQGFTTAISGNNSAGNILNNQYQNQLSAWNASQQSGSSALSGIGQLAGQLGASYITKYSSKKLKENKTKISHEDTLKKVKDLPVERWRYKDGIEDGGEHVGPYAEDIADSFGESAAPEGEKGKMIDMISMVGINLSATKALAKQVDKLSKSVSKIAANRGVKEARA